MNRAIIAAGIVAVCAGVAVAGTFVGETPNAGEPVMGALTESGASRFMRVYNTINDGGTESTLGVTLRASAGTASREVGTAAVPLRVDPTGTTAQTVTGTGTAGSPAAGVVTVQGITSGTAQPVSGTFWQATQPVSAASLPLPTGAATEATLAVSTPAGTIAAITPNDAGAISCSAVWVGTGGNIYVDALTSGTNVGFLSVPDGSVLPIRTTRVYATLTTATNLVCLAP